MTLAPEDLEEIWSQIDKHIKEQRKTIELAEQATASSRAYVQRYLLNYLPEDELKHDMPLERLEELRIGCIRTPDRAGKAAN